MSGYASGVLAIYLINLVIAYAVFLPATAGVINLGSAGFMAIGAYCSAYLNAALGLPVGIAIPCAALFAGLVGFLIAFPILRTRGIYLVLATYAFGEIVSGVLVNLDVVGGAAGYPVNANIGLNTITTCTIAVMVLMIYLANTRFGLSARAIHDDESVASLFGVHVRLAKVTAFTVGAAVGGLAGALYAHYYNYIDVGYFGAALSIYVLLYVLIGGTQTPFGPLVGAAVFSLVPEALRQSDRWRYVIFAAVIIILMAVRPEGIMTHTLIGRLAFWRQTPGAA
jgi:branched-chain amino acid transport system permease protein